MASPMQELFDTIREAAGTQIWSKGITLVRADAVTGDHESKDEVTLRVMDHDTGVGARVNLWLTDEDWHCDCGSAQDPCRHVAAAIIALKQARQAGKALPKSQQHAAVLSYHFTVADDQLCFYRKVTLDQEEEILTLPLSRLQEAAGVSLVSKVTPSKEDWAIERSLFPKRDGPLDRATCKRLFPHLRQLSREDQGHRVFFDGNAIAVSSKAVGHQAHLSRHPPQATAGSAKGWFLKGRANPQIKTVFKNGACLTTAGLALFHTPDLSEQDTTMLKQGRIFSAKESGELFGNILPRLASKLDVIQDEAPSPKPQPMSCWLDLRSQPGGKGLLLRPRIVYGDPPLAYVQGDELIAVDTMTIPRRNKEAEGRLSQKLQLHLGWQLGQTYDLAPPQAVDLAAHVTAMSSWVRDSNNGLAAFQVAGRLVPQVAFAGEQLTFSLHLASDSEEGATVVAASEAWQQFQKGQRFVALATGGLAELPETFLQQHGAAIMALLKSQTANAGTIPKGLWGKAQMLATELGVASGAAITAFSQQLTSAPQPTAWQPPPGFAATLRSYQHQGVAFLDRLRHWQLGALLADDMGLGKTVQTLAVLRGAALIVAPTSVLANWAQEAARWAPHTTVHWHHGKERLTPKALQDLVGRPQQLVLTSYTMLRLDLPLFSGVVFDELVLDEAHNIKNRHSQTARAAYQLQARFRLALTGTPVENSLWDVFAQFRFINPGLLGDSKSFENRFLKPCSQGDEAALSSLRGLMAPFLLRRRKKEVLQELPPKTEQTLYCTLDASEQTTYRSILAASQKDLITSLKEGQKSVAALEALLRLRQAACHRGLLPERSDPSSSKLDLLLEQLQVMISDGHKGLVFSQWTGFLDLIGAALTAANIPYLRLDGSSSNRGDIVARFNDDDEIPVLIMSLKAGGVGLNLTAADHVFITDPWWNPAAEEQAADRAYRIGQTKPVMVYRLVASGTIEEAMMALKTEKQNLAAATLEGAAHSAQLSADDILKLLTEHELP